jgi:hypothetical protein
MPLDRSETFGDPLLELAKVGTSSPASCQRVPPAAPAGVTPASRTAARLAVRLRRAPPATRSISSRYSRLMVWVRAATATETASSGRSCGRGRPTAPAPGRPAWPTRPEPARRRRPAAGPAPGRCRARLPRPGPVRPSCGPYPQGLVAVQGGSDALAVQYLVVLIQPGRGVRGLVGSRPSSPAWGARRMLLRLASGGPGTTAVAGLRPVPRRPLLTAAPCPGSGLPAASDPTLASGCRRSRPRRWPSPLSQDRRGRFPTGRGSRAPRHAR